MSESDDLRMAVQLVWDQWAEAFGQAPPKAVDAWAAAVRSFDALDARVAAAQAALQRVETLFNGGPDTSCRTVWEDGIECVSVPIADLRRALAAVPSPDVEETR